MATALPNGKGSGLMLPDAWFSTEGISIARSALAVFGQQIRLRELWFSTGVIFR
jgi:hypothetical protein